MTEMGGGDVMSVEDVAAAASSVTEEASLDAEVVKASFVRRTEVLLTCRDSKRAQGIQLAMCAEDPVHFFNTFAITYDPRLINKGLPAYIPFDLFRRQEELVRWIGDRVAAAEEGLLEKSRDIGWTWVAAGYALNRWLFVPGFRSTFGSRKVDLVDKLGDPDSILEKVRLMIDRLPPWMLPKGWRKDVHANHCKISNPENGNIIGGEGGAEIGRGGRATLMLLDEAAYLDHADTVAAAVLANADCRVWASSVNGPGDFFARKRHDGTLRPDQIFTFAWRDDPRKTDEWAAKKKKELAATPWMWSKEYQIDYTAAVEGICIPAAWVQAAVKLGELIPFDRSMASCVAGLDIGDTCARSVLQPRFGPLLVPPVSWGMPDTTNTAFAALETAKQIGVHIVNYDSIGVGKGVQSTLTLNPVAGVVVNPINVGRPPSWRTVWPDGQSSRMKFANLKAELWWIARERFRCAAEHLSHLTGEEIQGVEANEHDVSDVFLFEPAPGHAYRETIVQLSLPIRQFNTQGKIIIESKHDLSKRGVSSPDFAEGLVLSLVPSDTSAGAIVSPIIVSSERGYPELDGGSSGRRTEAKATGSVHLGGYQPALPTGKRFDQDFSRDW